ncbi:MAG: hypothetical protein EOM16_06800, partial [Bacteroidia bacterium]|nr:hypothetical protein [Bacteroidia bacterium]
MKNKYIDLIEQSFDFPQDEFRVEDGELYFHNIPMMHVIQQYGLVDILFKSTSYISYIQDIEKALDQLFKDEPKIFGKGFKATTMDNFVKLY